MKIASDAQEKRWVLETIFYISHRKKLSIAKFILKYLSEGYEHFSLDITSLLFFFSALFFFSLHFSFVDFACHQFNQYPKRNHFIHPEKFWRSPQMGEKKSLSMLWDWVMPEQKVKLHVKYWKTLLRHKIILAQQAASHLKMKVHK